MLATFTIIEDSFRKSTKGEESINNVIWWWGLCAYLVAFFIAEKLILKINFRSVDILISTLMLIFFCWHLYALKKCSPKKPVLTKEEKLKKKIEARQNLGKKFLRKLFLQEPLTQTNPVIVAVVVDLYCAAHFAGYIFR